MNAQDTTARREARLRIALWQLAAEEVPEGPDLWPALLARVRTPRTHRPAGHRRVVLVAALLVALLAIGGTAVAAGTDTLQRFGMLLLSPSVVERRTARPQATADGRGAAAPQVVATPRAVEVRGSLEDAQRQVAFRLRTPSWLPAGVEFRGARADADGRGGGMSYRATDGSLGGFGVIMRQGQEQGGYAVPGSATRPVQVHGLPAVYVQGAWNEADQWQPAADAGLLSWQEDGFTFVLTHSGLHLSREDVLRIAESLR